MDVTGPETSAPKDGAPDDATLREIARVRESGVLGEAGRLRELFDFLAARADDPVPPKEVEIAASVFGKPDAPSGKDNPAARVYVHRLRKRLDEYYRREAPPDGVRLDVPKGQYRLVGRRVAAAPVAQAAAQQDGPGAAGPAPAQAGSQIGSQAGNRAGGRTRGLVAAGIAALLALNVLAWAVLAPLSPSGADGADGHPVWSGMRDAGRPLTVAVGDYYLFGEYDDTAFLHRLVRDFGINSREELLRRQLEDESGFARYADVNLRYLPVSVAVALARIMPDMPPGKPVRVVLASDLGAETIKTDDIVYIGLLSGLGQLIDPVLGQSRFAIGGSYDALIDLDTGRSYVSGAFQAEPLGGAYRDYGFFASFDGPAGNRIAVIAGARDTAVAGVAESLARPGHLEALRAAAGGATAFEALYEIDGRQNVSLDARILVAAPLDSARIWMSDPMLAAGGADIALSSIP